MNLVFLCDSPTRDTGFGRVSANLVERWQDIFNIFIWGIGYDGLPHQYKCHIAPANINSQWKDKENLNRFEAFLNSIPTPFTLLTLNDAFRLNGLIPIFERAKKRFPFKIVSYTPIDGPLLEHETEFLKYTDIIVAYTEFGKAEIQKFSAKPTFVIPHGVDDRFFQMEVNRRRVFPSIHPEDFLITNVNTNSPRKAPHKSIELLSKLLQYDDSFKLYMHMPPVGLGNYNLRYVAEHFKIPNEALILADPLFDQEKSRCSTDLVNIIYNCSDLILSTSLGEGWGLSASEAALTKTPIAVPNHTSFAELYNSDNAIMLPCNHTVILPHDQSRVRPCIDVDKAAEIIINKINSGVLHDLAEANYENVLKFNWNNIAKQWLEIFLLAQR